MLRIVIPEREFFNEADSTFIQLKEQHIQMEHSLISLSKWERKWHKPFLTDEKKTIEETIDYFKCMTLSQGIDDLIYQTLPPSVVNEINDYVENPMTATWFSDTGHPPSREIITSEIIYYAMIKFNIPFECQKWHLNSLFTLIRVCSLKEGPSKKMSSQEIMARNRELNEARKARMNTKG